MGKYSKVIKQCRHCLICFEYSPGGKDIRTGHGGMYCSNHCRWASQKKPVEAKFCKCNISNCLWCGELFVGRLGQKICSNDCKKDRQSKRAAAKKRQQKKIITITCAECGEVFNTVYGVKNSIYCSDSCSRSVENRVKHSEQLVKKENRVERIDPFKVFARDGWRCQICGRKVKKSRRGTYHDRAPEIDHIVPRAKGGKHSYKNTQCTCRLCNRIKGSREVGQLRLF